MSNPDFSFSEYSGKRILVLGFGREGRSTLRFFRKHIPKAILGVADQKDLSADPLIKELKPDSVHFGKDHLAALGDYDFVFKTPGISFKEVEHKTLKTRITCQADFFLQYWGAQSIGISGTKGKSTTSSLVHFGLQGLNIPSRLIGNIGVPLLDAVIDDLQTKEQFVCELSSHQLEFCAHSPHIAILLNVFPEHLDHYENFEAYRLAKWNLVKAQVPSDFAILWNGLEVPNSIHIQSEVLKYNNIPENHLQAYEKSERVHFQLENSIEAVGVTQFDFLPGAHNRLNIMATILAMYCLKVPITAALPVFEKFKGLSHRLEDIGTVNGVRFINDSISTIPESAIAAVKAFSKVSAIILGGYDRGLDYSKLIDFLLQNPIEFVVGISQTGEEIVDLLKSKAYSQSVFYFETLDEAVEYLLEVVEDGVCLLSPAASSYDQYDNFEERGNAFRSLVLGEGS